MVCLLAACVSNWTLLCFAPGFKLSDLNFVCGTQPQGGMDVFKDV